MPFRHRFATTLIVLFCCSIKPTANAQSLEAELKRSLPAQIALEALERGDASRGAVVFHQPHIACSRCHSVGSGQSSLLGPDLAAIAKDTSDAALVESILEPSKVICKGFQSVTVATDDGIVRTGLLVERTESKTAFRDAGRNGELVTFKSDDLADYKLNETSLMPTGQVNQLTSRQQFLDLVRYLIEIRDGGAVRAKELQPSAALIALSIPEYEQHLDHSGLVSRWNEDSFKRGEAIYQRVCANCHGTKDKAGSLPTSLRFGSGKFKNGSDPYAMYRTLTYGFGQMVPQAWMVPSQKYDVIHYIREAYLKHDNPTQYVELAPDLLAGLPKGDTFGPEPSKIETWSAMDYGPSLTHTYEIPGKESNIAFKGIAVRLDPGTGGVSRGRHWMLWDSDTMRVAAAWNSTGGKGENFIDWQGIQFNGAHGVHPRIVGKNAFANSTGPGWGAPATATQNGFKDDQRVIGRDGKPYGPLPRSWAKFLGQYHHGQQVILKYTVDGCEVLESPSLHLPNAQQSTSQSPANVSEQPVPAEGKGWVLRTFNVAPHPRPLTLQVAEHVSKDAMITAIDHPKLSMVSFGDAVVRRGNGPIDTEQTIFAAFAPPSAPVQFLADQRSLRLRLEPNENLLRFSIWQPIDNADLQSTLMSAKSSFDRGQLNVEASDRDLSELIKGGPGRWPERIETQMVTTSSRGPLAVDVLSAPESNPWLAQTRFTGLDFYPDGRIAVCTWDGDVWVVTPIDGKQDERGEQTGNAVTGGVRETDNDVPGNSRRLSWQRVASGLFQPLGLKIIEGKIHLTCRDQLVVLHDLNGDSETDFYQCLNNDHQVTTHFHEFAMGLQIDHEGNFYYAKSGCHGIKATVPHHGTLLRVSKDGLQTEILATGFRAANGVCLNPDGTFFVTDQEGFWNPKNRINWVSVPQDGQPNFYGNMWGYHDVTDESDNAVVPPLCWITNAFDRSPAELLWVDSKAWGPLNGSLLNLSYGYGKVFLVPHERVGDLMQGGMIELPIPSFPTGVMRGRFSADDGCLYLCGMFAWAGNATQPGGLYRLRATGKPLHLPTKLSATQDGLRLTFTDQLASNSITKDSIQIKTWSLKRTANYGSKHFNEKPLEIDSVELLNDGKTVVIHSTQLQSTWCMEIQYDFRATDGESVTGTMHNTIHALKAKP
jgi:putative heme-binding domain-containing protein